MEFTIAMPAWWYVFYITIPYGIVTHYKALPAVRRHNKKCRNGTQINPLVLFLVLLGRMTVILPFRLVMLLLAVIWMAIWLALSFAAGTLEIGGGGLFRLGWRWHLKPIDLYVAWF